MRSTVHPATERDLTTVADVLASVRGSADSGAAVFGLLQPAVADFAVRPWQVGDSQVVVLEFGESWTAPSPGAGSGIACQRAGDRFQFGDDI